jgi:hypothetical protein
MLATIAVTLGSFAIHFTQRKHGNQTETGLIITILGGATAALLVYRVLINLPASNKVVDQKLGALLGVLSAIGIAVGGFESLREERARARRLAQRARPANSEESP